jgi:hypothetical protein
VLEAMRRENAEFQRALLATLSNRPAETARSPVDFVKDTAAMISAVKEILPQPSATTADTFKAALEFVREIGGERGGGETGILDLVQTAISSQGVQDVLGALAQGIREARTTAPPAPAAPGRPMPGPPPAPAPVALPPVPPALEQVAAFLVDKAQRGEDPAQWAGHALDALPPELLDAIDRLPDNGMTEVDYLARLHPGVAANRNWFSALIERM